MTRITITSPRRRTKPTAQLDLFDRPAQPAHETPPARPALATIPTTWATRGGRHPIRFRDPATGQTWTGRGLRPKWLQARIDEGRQINEFEVKEYECKGCC